MFSDSLILGCSYVFVKGPIAVIILIRGTWPGFRSVIEVLVSLQPEEPIGSDI